MILIGSEVEIGLYLHYESFFLIASDWKYSVSDSSELVVTDHHKVAMSSERNMNLF